MQDNFAEVTALHPLALVAVLMAGFCLLVLPRRYALASVILFGFLVPMNQRVVILGLDWFVLRILILFGWVRLLSRGEFRSMAFSAMDRLVLLWVAVMVLSYTLLWQTFGAFINRLGFAFNVVGIYFLGRTLVRNLDDLEILAKWLSRTAMIVAVFMLVEYSTQKNFFSIFGGVPVETILRDGKLRCQGPFGHPIMAGTFGATLLPLFWSLWWWGGESGKRFAVLGGLASTLITLTSSSSGPLLTYVAGVTGLLLWPLRKRVRTICWGLVLMILGLHIVMKAPVWALLWRVKVLSASTSYHRFVLFDQFVKRFDEWWIIGTKSTSDWGDHLFDVTNQYVRFGVDGGIVGLTLFVLILFLCIKGLGGAFRRCGDDARLSRLIWGLGVCLFAHVVSFWGVSYWDQMILDFYFSIAAISSVNERIAFHEVEHMGSRVRLVPAREAGASSPTCVGE